MSNFRYLVVFALFMSIPAVPVLAQDTPAPAAPAAVAPASPEEALTVKDLLIEKTSTDAVAARKEAILEAQRQALLKLAGFPAEGKTPPALPDDTTIAGFVRDFSLRNEQISVNRYAALFTVRFTPKVVDFVKDWADADVAMPEAAAASELSPAEEVQNAARAEAAAGAPTSLSSAPEQAQENGKLALDVTMTFSSFQEWVEAQKRLQSMTPVPVVAISGLSSNSARCRITVAWPGGLEAFEAALAEKHLLLEQGAGGYTLRMN